MHQGSPKVAIPFKFPVTGEPGFQLSHRAVIKICFSQTSGLRWSPHYYRSFLLCIFTQPFTAWHPASKWGSERARKIARWNFKFILCLNLVHEILFLWLYSNLKTKFQYAACNEGKKLYRGISISARQVGTVLEAACAVSATQPVLFVRMSGLSSLKCSEGVAQAKGQLELIFPNASFSACLNQTFLLKIYTHKGTTSTFLFQFLIVVLFFVVILLLLTWTFIFVCLCISWCLVSNPQPHKS